MENRKEIIEFLSTNFGVELSKIETCFNEQYESSVEDNEFVSVKFYNLKRDGVNMDYVSATYSNGEESIILTSKIDRWIDKFSDTVNELKI